MVRLFGLICDSDCIVFLSLVQAAQEPCMAPDVLFHRNTDSRLLSPVTFLLFPILFRKFHSFVLMDSILPEHLNENSANPSTFVPWSHL